MNTQDNDGQGGIVVRAQAEGLQFSLSPTQGFECSLTKWFSGGNAGEIKVARKGIGHPTSHKDGSG